MAITERQGITGRLTILLRDKEGREVEHRQVNNVITTDGKNLLAQYFTGAIQTVPKLYIAVGSDGDTKADAANKELGARLEEAEATATVDGNIATVEATLLAKEGEAQEPQQLREAGIHIYVEGRKNVDEKPVLYNRVTFPVVNKSGNMEMTLTWEVIF